MAFDVITTERDVKRYCGISTGTLFSPVDDLDNYYLKLEDYEVEGECSECNEYNTFYDCDICANIRTGQITSFNLMTECIVYTHSELKLTR
jgi:hypothetical protein